MKHLTKIIFAFFIFFPALLFAKVQVVTTTSDLAALTREVGQDLVSVESIARGDQDPHYLEPKPSYILEVNRADLLVEVGLQLEIGWLPVLVTQSRNPKIQRGELGRLIASEGLPILEIPTGTIDRSQGDIHPEGNPHCWLDPKNGLKIASKIAERLGQIDPEHKTAYAENFKKFETVFSQKIKGWEKEAQSLRGKKIVAYHKSLSYFAHWIGLDVAGFVESKPGIPPSPGHMEALIEQMKKEKIPLIVAENFYDPKESRELGRRTGAKVLIIPASVGGESGIKTYADLFDRLIGRIREALQ